MSSRLHSPGIRTSVLLVLLIFKAPIAKSQELSTIITEWHQLGKGLFYSEQDAPEKSILNDSKIFMLRADPRLCNFRMLCASQHGNQNRTAEGWATDFGMDIVVNAGMFNMTNKRTSKGYLKNFTHLNNPRINPGYNVMMAMNPKMNSDTSMIICDMTCNNLDTIRAKYHTLCQGMRMIDCNGNPLAWDKRPGQACSMVIGATDTAGNIYFVFTRSPYTHQKMIGFLFRLIPSIRTAVYLEGGPEASLYIHSGDTVIAKFGSYVSGTYANDNNDHFWKIPNVIGIKLPKGLNN